MSKHGSKQCLSEIGSIIYLLPNLTITSQDTFLKHRTPAIFFLNPEGGGGRNLFGYDGIIFDLKK